MQARQGELAERDRVRGGTLRIINDLSPMRPFPPPQELLPPASSKNLPFPRVTDLEVLPARTQRHVPDLIVPMRERLAIAIARSLPRCPCCTRLNSRGAAVRHL